MDGTGVVQLKNVKTYFNKTKLTGTFFFESKILFGRYFFWFLTFTVGPASSPSIEVDSTAE